MFPCLLTTMAMVNTPKLPHNRFSECCGSHPESTHKAETCGEPIVGQIPRAGQLIACGITLTGSPCLTCATLVCQAVPICLPIEAATTGIQLALASCGQVVGIKIEDKLEDANDGQRCTKVVSAAVKSGPDARARSYKATQLAKESLEAISKRLEVMSLLSARTQKAEDGYRLRSSIVCVPDYAKGTLCRQGTYCKNKACRWYHPQEADIKGIKVNIRCNDDADELAKDNQIESNLSTKKHQICLEDALIEADEVPLPYSSQL